MENPHKQKKKKSNSKNNSNHSSSNNSNASDENKNSLNNSGNNSKEKNIIQTNKNEQTQQKNDKLNQLKNLKYIFPFYSEEKDEDNKIKNYSISEYNKIVSSINNSNENKISDKNKYEEDILEGKINIIDNQLLVIIRLFKSIQA